MKLLPSMKVDGEPEQKSNSEVSDIVETNSPIIDSVSYIRLQNVKLQYI